MISCIILAGGRSSRMNIKRKETKERVEKKGKKGSKKATLATFEKEARGKSKAFIKLDGKPLVVHVFDVMKKFFPEIIIVVKTKQQKAEMEKIVADPKVKVVTDKSRVYSPIVGIQTGIEATDPAAKDVFVVACDTPFISGVTIFRMMNKMRKDVDCVVPSKSGKHQPLCAVYKRSIFKKMAPDESLHNVIENCNKKIQIPIYDDNAFFNINTREDLQKAEAMIKEGKS